MVDTLDTQSPPVRTAALELLAMLTERYPATFTHEGGLPKPLTIGISDQLITELALAPAIVHTAMRLYTRRRSYQKALSQPGAMRVGLDGTPTEPVAPEHQAAARTPRRPARAAQGTPPASESTPSPMLLTLDLWKGLTPMPVTATLKLVLRDLPETREQDGMVYMALQNEPRGLPKGVTLDSGPLYLTSPVKQWKTACTRAEQIRTNGTSALLIVEAHVSTRDGALVGVVKGVQVVEGKAASPTSSDS
jgi:ProQ/FINO family